MKNDETATISVPRMSKGEGNRRIFQFLYEVIVHGRKRTDLLMEKPRNGAFLSFYCHNKTKCESLVFSSMQCHIHQAISYLQLPTLSSELLSEKRSKYPI